MDFKLHVRMTGLWVYVPKKTPTPGAADNRLRLLAVETRHAQLPRQDWHEPVLLVDKDHVIEDGWGHSGEFSTAGRSLLLYRLEGRTLEIGDAAQDALEIVTGTVNASRSFPRDAAEERDYRWLPEMEKVAPGHGSVLPGVLTDTPRFRDKVAARVDISSGELHTRFVARDCNGGILQWQLNGSQRAVAEEMEVTQVVSAPGRSPSVRLAARSWLGGGETFLRLQPKGGQVVVYLKNVPVDEHLGEIRPKGHRAGSGMPHFHHLGALFANPTHLNDPTSSTQTWPDPATPADFLPCSNKVLVLGSPQCPGLAGNSGP